MVTKTYQNLICPLFSTHIEVKGERRDLRFIVGGKDRPMRINGKLRTSDPELIKALDESPYYGKKWVCINTRGDVEAETQEEAQETTETVEGPTEVNGPKTAKEMREYLNKKLGVPYSQLPNKDAALEVAKKMNLDFVNVS